MRTRQHKTPLLIQGPGSPAVPLRPVPFGAPPISEEDLQRLLAEHPHVLPVDDIEPAFEPLVKLGREVPTAAGPIDLLLTSPTGYLTLVETKLWRNPEARRKVVGQILDYSKELARWTFEDLDRAVRQAADNDDRRGIAEIVQAADRDCNEQELVDALSLSLCSGHFLIDARRGIAVNHEVSTYNFMVARRTLAAIGLQCPV